MAFIKLASFQTALQIIVLFILLTKLPLLFHKSQPVINRVRTEFPLAREKKNKNKNTPKPLSLQVLGQLRQLASGRNSMVGKDNLSTSLCFLLYWFGIFSLLHFFSLNFPDWFLQLLLQSSFLIQPPLKPQRCAHALSPSAPSSCVCAYLTTWKEQTKHTIWETSWYFTLREDFLSAQIKSEIVKIAV